MMWNTVLARVRTLTDTVRRRMPWPRSPARATRIVSMTCVCEHHTFHWPVPVDAQNVRADVECPACHDTWLVWIRNSEIMLRIRTTGGDALDIVTTFMEHAAPMLRELDPDGNETFTRINGAL